MMTEINGWSVLTDFKRIIEPLVSATNTLGASKYVTSSLVRERVCECADAAQIVKLMVTAYRDTQLVYEHAKCIGNDVMYV
jgi:hypothetical protein